MPVWSTTERNVHAYIPQDYIRFPADGQYSTHIGSINITKECVKNDTQGVENRNGGDRMKNDGQTQRGHRRDSQLKAISCQNLSETDVRSSESPVENLTQVFPEASLGFPWELLSAVRTLNLKCLSATDEFLTCCCQQKSTLTLHNISAKALAN
ncbi:hypothetical protein Q8A67_020287 [Cirrhinus molitorella]|uniref:Uncharacterized protein n=1 Tax=Cirrhinus molitorella TaxID=172907 RepID=A0AA88PBL6_9TELE|nr:hypothetical protein Q8A67_020287 [Cirrhinus molitorella]